MYIITYVECPFDLCGCDLVELYVECRRSFARCATTIGVRKTRTTNENKYVLNSAETRQRGYNDFCGLKQILNHKALYVLNTTNTNCPVNNIITNKSLDSFYDFR